MKLTDAKARKSTPRDKDYKLPDGHGLYLLVTARGSKLWRMKYRVGGKEKLLSFGAYPEISLLEARNRREEARRQLREGIDPAAEKKRQEKAARVAAANDFETVARQWFDVVKGPWSTEHADDVLSSLEKNIFPLIGAMPISKIEVPDVLDALRAAEARGVLETAKRLRQRISAVFVYAISEGKAVSDPAAIVAGAMKPKKKARHHPAIVDLEELRVLMRDVESAGASPVTVLASRVLALTAVRSAVLRGMPWDELKNIDWDSDDDQPDALWHVPAARMKLEQDRKDEQAFDHLVPLGRQAVDALRAMRALTGRGKLVFPGQRHAHRPLSENTIGYLYNRLGYQGRHVAHGWRSSFSTMMNETVEREWRAAGNTGVAPDRAIIDMMLAHTPKGMSASEIAYNRAAYMPRRRELAQQWADMLMEGLPPAADLLLLDRRPAPKREEKEAARRAHLEWARRRALDCLPGRPKEAAAGFLSDLRTWEGGAVLHMSAQKRLREKLLAAVEADDSAMIQLLIETVE